MTPISAVNLGVQSATAQTVRQPVNSGSGSDTFGNLFHAAAAQVAKVDNDAQSAVSGLLNGQGVEVHDAIIAAQKSELTFQLALQVRNKAVSAYQTMMQMQF